MANQVKLAVINLPADDPEKTSEFYSKLLGIEFSRSPTDDTVSYGAPLSDDGTYMSIKRKERPDEGATVFFAVDNLDEVVATFEDAGGRLVVKHELPLSPKVREEYARQYQNVYNSADYPQPTTMGSSAVVTDNAGNRIGLIQVDEHAHVMFKMGRHTLVKTTAFEAAQEAAKAIERAYKG